MWVRPGHRAATCGFRLPVPARSSPRETSPWRAPPMCRRPTNSRASAKTRLAPARTTTPSPMHTPIRAGDTKLVLISTVGRNRLVFTKTNASESGASSMATTNPPWTCPKMVAERGLRGANWTRTRPWSSSTSSTSNGVNATHAGIGWLARWARNSSAPKDMPHLRTADPLPVDVVSPVSHPGRGPLIGPRAPPSGTVGPYDHRHANPSSPMSGAPSTFGV